MTNQNENPLDAKLDALLDEALAPGAVDAPAGLADRVFAATRGAVEARQGGVLARIGPARLTALAAMILLIAGAAIWLRFAPATAVETTPNSNAIARVRAELRHLSDYDGPHETIDHDLAELAIRVDHAHRGDADASGLFEGLDEVDAATLSGPMF